MKIYAVQSEETDGEYTNKVNASYWLRRKDAEKELKRERQLAKEQGTSGYVHFSIMEIDVKEVD